MNQVSFPGFGIGPFTLNPDFIKIGDFAIKWYAVIIVIGMITAALYVFWRGRKIGLLFDDLLDLFLFIVFPAVIGTRLYYVIFKKLEDPTSYTTFLEVINIRDGGLAIYGGIITGALMVFIVTKIKKINLAAFCDIIAPGVMIAQAIGRWGNFVNIEAYGSETTLPWRMGITDAFGNWSYVHPTFLYESLWNLLGFILILLFQKKKKHDGQVVLSYIAWYGFGRMLIEGLRTDSLYIGNTGIRVSQLLAGIFFISALGALIFLGFFIKGRRVADNVYLKEAGHYEMGVKAIERYNEKVAEKKAARMAKKEEKRKEREASLQSKDV